jgi:hypothetical protein
MFAYFSLLVEQFVFDTIHVNFLIVGHTHSSIDQYFSVLTGTIRKTQFIASPLSLMELLKIAHTVENIDKRPSIVRQIEVYYDFVSAVKPYIPSVIKVKYFLCIILIQSF